MINNYLKYFSKELEKIAIPIGTIANTAMNVGFGAMSIHDARTASSQALKNFSRGQSAPFNLKPSRSYLMEGGRFLGKSPNIQGV